MLLRAAALLLTLFLLGCSAEKASVRDYLAGWKGVDQRSAVMLEEMQREYPRIVDLVGNGKLDAKALGEYEAMLLSWQDSISQQRRDLESLPVGSATRSLHNHSLRLLEANSQSLDRVLLMLTLCAELQGKHKKSKGKQLEGVRGELQQVLSTLGEEQTEAGEASAKIREELTRLSSRYSLDLEALQARS